MTALLLQASLILLGVVALYLVILRVFRVPKSDARIVETKRPPAKARAHREVAAIGAALACLESERRHGASRISVQRTKAIPSLWCAAGRQNFMGGRRNR